MKYLKGNAGTLATIAFLIIVGVLLLVNPETFAVVVVKVAGVLLMLLGAVDIIKYFRTPAPEAVQGQSFYSGAVLITVGCFGLFASGWFVKVFPVLAVIYGLMQILLGLRKLQRTVDALRLKLPLWHLRGLSAVISLAFGFLIALNPEMTVIGIWVFTGLSMILEGVFDAAVLFLTGRRKPAEKAAPAEHA